VFYGLQDPFRLPLNNFNYCLKFTEKKETCNRHEVLLAVRNSSWYTDQC